MKSYYEKFDINCEWGLKGIEALSPSSDVIIIVDVLSFSTSVDIACENGARVYPQLMNLEDNIYGSDFIVAKSRTQKEFSLSPYSLLGIQAGTNLVLPSPNGSALSLATGNTLTLCGCLRNFRSVADYAMKNGKRISVIPAGEKWEDGSTRFALEDLFGAGAVLSCLKGSHSPECMLAINTYHSLHNLETETLLNCSSGVELIEKGFEVDVYLAGDMNVSTTIPVLNNGYYSNFNTETPN